MHVLKNFSKCAGNAGFNYSGSIAEGAKISTTSEHGYPHHPNRHLTNHVKKSLTLWGVIRIREHGRGKRSCIWK